MHWQTTLTPVVKEMQRDGTAPGMVIAVQRAGEAPEYLVTGVDAAAMPLSADSLFPVASITKLATALAILRLVAAGELALDTPLARYLPEAAAARVGVTLRMLLTHTSGLPYDIGEGLAPYAPELTWRRLAQGCLQTPLTRPPRTRVVYSNVGVGLLALVVERLTGQVFAEALAEFVLTPLKIEAYLGVEPPNRPAVIERTPDARTGTPIEPFNSGFWRSLALPWGGLLTTATGTLTLVEAFTDRPAGFLSRHLLVETVRDQTGGLPGGLYGPWQWAHCPWGLGIELRGRKDPHWTPPQASPESFGHVGASGCLVWRDPAIDFTWVILGTRTFDLWWDRWAILGATLLTTKA